MKKLAFGLIATVFFGNMSFGQNSDFKELYNQYINSSSYEDFKVSFAKYYDMLNIDSDKINFKTESDIKDWVNNNINKTSFGSLEKYNQDFENLKKKFISLAEENSLLFKELTNNQKDYVTFLNIESNEVITSYVSGRILAGVNDCINDAVDCQNDANDNYAAGIGGSGLSFFYNPIVAAGTAIVATIVHHNAINGCNRTFRNCIHNCCGY